VDIHDSVALVARRNVAANGLSQRITVASRDVGLVERGREVRQLGCNFVVMDLFDSGLLGDHVGQLLAMASRNVLQPGATVVPAAATVYCMGIEALTGDVRGFDFKAFNKYRCARMRSHDAPRTRVPACHALRADTELAPFSHTLQVGQRVRERVAERRAAPPADAPKEGV
jgi:hypothetical protein